jgi:hypothetical protein
MTSCLRPLPEDLLAEYWSGELDPDREVLVEQHVLACGVCSARLESLVEIAHGIRLLARRGELRVVLTPEFIARLEREGLRVRQYSPKAGDSVQCTITTQDDLLVGRLAADLTGLTRVDVVLCDASGKEWGRVEDIPFRAAPTDVVLNEPAGAARRYGHQVLIVKLIGADAEGERLIGEYRFNHSPTPG